MYDYIQSYPTVIEYLETIYQSNIQNIINRPKRQNHPVKIERLMSRLTSTTILTGDFSKISANLPNFETQLRARLIKRSTLTETAARRLFQSLIAIKTRRCRFLFGRSRTWKPLVPFCMRVLRSVRLDAWKQREGELSIQSRVTERFARVGRVRRQSS